MVTQADNSGSAFADLGGQNASSSSSVTVESSAASAVDAKAAELKTTLMATARGNTIKS